MPYRLHPADRRTVIERLIRELATVPEDELDSIMLEARAGLTPSTEEGKVGKVIRLHHPEYQLISRATRLLAERRPLEAWEQCFMDQDESSLFSPSVRQVYCRPANDMEREISDGIRMIIIRIAENLIAFNPLSKGTGPSSDGWMGLTALHECLVLLGADVPEGLVSELKRLMAEYRTAAPEHVDLKVLELQVRNRFGA